jgi:cysteinyl-tRNA synthetase
MPIVLSVLWEMVKDPDLGGKIQLELITQFDQILGLGIENFQKVELSKDLLALVKERESVRATKNWARADELRKELLEKGICLKDSPGGTDWYLKY